MNMPSRRSLCHWNVSLPVPKETGLLEGSEFLPSLLPIAVFLDIVTCSFSHSMSLRKKNVEMGLSHVWDREQTPVWEKKKKSPTWSPQAWVKLSTESRSLFATWEAKLSCNIPANSYSHSECYPWLLGCITNRCRGKFNYLSGTK